MHLVILGATGRTGAYGYKYALEQGKLIQNSSNHPARTPQPTTTQLGKHKLIRHTGHHVTALVRKATGLQPHKNLTIVEGSVQSAADVDRAFTASSLAVDAAVLFLNAPRTSDNPWAKFIGPPRLIADAAANAARALRRQKASSSGQKPRLVVMCAIGVGESRAVAPLITRLLIDYTNVGKTYEDHEKVDAEIEENCGADVDWTVALPVALKDAGDKPVKTFASTQSGAGLFISRESCAKWMVRVAAGEQGAQFSNRRVIISN